ncbi:GNAT family N-acetyltransferase [Stutzerimonas stutzeri]|uniref:GNAT family N-acetyltransferase n=1 Tax=Stutzerimonas stutzeri TaxID=316 RepID=UPI0004AEC178|nr:GNAT family N-acetyltransferase [Stutzerimonas stutzeri]MCQ4328057.1 N-acetyltransferase [Stutzerimonas stutzeri]
MSDATVRHDGNAHRYVLNVNGQDLGFAEYREQGPRQVFTHTEVDPSLAGQGMGSKLIRESLDDAVGAASASCRYAISSPIM